MDGTVSGSADTSVHFKRHPLDVTGLSKYFRSQVLYQPEMKILNVMKLDESTVFIEWLIGNRKALKIQCFHSSIFQGQSKFDSYYFHSMFLNIQDSYLTENSPKFRKS